MTEQNSTDEANVAFRAYTEKGKGTDSLMKVYDDTAGKYDEFMITIKYCGPDLLGKTIKEFMKDKTDVNIIDVCAGTGLSGVAMYNAGFRNIDALDGCQTMLDNAEKKGVYGKLFCELIGDKDLNISKRSYDVATLVGAFHENHLRCTAFRYIIPLVKPGGYIINIMREHIVNTPWYGEGLEPYMAQLEKEGLWKQVSRDVVPGYAKEQGCSVDAVIHIYQVL